MKERWKIPKLGTVFLARCVRGLESHTWDDIDACTNSNLLELGHRTVFFSSKDPLSKLIELRSVDDLFCLIKIYQQLDHTRAALDSMKDQTGASEIDAAVTLCKTLRDIPKNPSFTITASFLGKRNYNRWDVADSVKSAIIGCRRGWTFLDNKSTAPPPHDLHFRVHLEDDSGFLAVRVNALPLYKRRYKINHQPGSLHPAVAYHMIRSAELPNGCCILDPMSGVGTIPIEATENGFQAIGIELDKETLRLFEENCSVVDPRPYSLNGDAARMPLDAASVEAIICDLPWGVQTELGGEAVDYALLLNEFTRVVKPNGKIVLMSESNAELSACASTIGLELKREVPISLSGRHPSILVFKKL